MRDSFSHGGWERGECGLDACSYFEWSVVRGHTSELTVSGYEEGSALAPQAFLNYLCELHHLRLCKEEYSLDIER